MTYFNPKKKNKNNLKEKDRKDLEWMETFFKNIILNTVGQSQEFFNSGSDTLDKIHNELMDTVREDLMEELGNQLHELCIGIIDNYEDDDVEEIENAETFLYEPKYEDEE